MERGRWSPRGQGAIRELGNAQVMRGLKGDLGEREKIFSLSMRLLMSFTQEMAYF